MQAEKGSFIILNRKVRVTTAVIVFVLATSSINNHQIPFVQCIVNCAYVIALAWENEYTRKFALNIK